MTDLKAGLSRLCSTVMASTSGPLSATNLASFSAISLDSASTGGETLSSLSVLGLNSHSYYCTVFNQPSHTTSLEPIEDKKRSKEGQEGEGGVNGGPILYSNKPSNTFNTSFSDTKLTFAIRLQLHKGPRHTYKEERETRFPFSPLRYSNTLLSIFSANP